jgi:hypothetical protein
MAASWVRRRSRPWLLPGVRALAIFGEIGEIPDLPDRLARYYRAAPDPGGKFLPGECQKMAGLVCWPRSGTSAVVPAGACQVHLDVVAGSAAAS